MDETVGSEAMGTAGSRQQAEEANSSMESEPACSSGGGWGTCAELLLVSAVKKHGVPNWNLVALELKSRAILLNVSPSHFSDEACRFKYNALKVKFTGGISPREDDVNAVAWFEELRKLRVSRLKEELQGHDNSIFQLQSKISKLKEERAQSPSIQILKQCDTGPPVDFNSRVWELSNSQNPDAVQPDLVALDDLQEQKSNGEPPKDELELVGDIPQVTSSCVRDEDQIRPDLAHQEMVTIETTISGQNVDAHGCDVDGGSGEVVQQETGKLGLQDTYPEQHLALEQCTAVESPKMTLPSGAPDSSVSFENSIESRVQKSGAAVEVSPDGRAEDPSCSPDGYGAQVSGGRLKECGAPESIDAADSQGFAQSNDEAEDHIAEEKTHSKGHVPEETVEVEKGPVEEITETQNVAVENEIKVDGAGSQSGVSGTSGGDQQVEPSHFDMTTEIHFSTNGSQESQMATAEAPDLTEPKVPKSGDSDSPKLPDTEANEVQAVSPKANVSSGQDGSREVYFSQGPRFSKLSLSYGRQQKEKRLRSSKDEPELKPGTGTKVEEHDVLPAQVKVDKTSVLEAANSTPIVDKNDGDETNELEEQREGVPNSVEDRSESVLVDIARPSEEGAVSLPSRSPENGREPLQVAEADDDKGRKESTMETAVSRVDEEHALPSSPSPSPRSSPLPDTSKQAEAMDLVVDLLPTYPSDLGFEHRGPRPDVGAAESPVLDTGSNDSKQDVSQLVRENDDSLREVSKSDEMKLSDSSVDDATMAEAEIEKQGEQVRSEAGSSEIKLEASKDDQDHENMGMEIEMAREKANVETEVETEATDPHDDGTMASKGNGNIPEANFDVPAVPEANLDVSAIEEMEEDRKPLPEDSHVDKSELGSSMDSVEDMSPSSRKNRREPRVSGKFLPLLECLRVICANKFAPLFRQRQEHMDSQYDRLVRRHVDLSMVRSRLEDGAYSGSVEFFRDLLLIFTNALVYYGRESQEYAGAKVLRKCALTEMDKIMQTEALLKQSGPATRKREGRKSAEAHKSRLSSISGSEPTKKGISKGGGNSGTNEAASASSTGGKHVHVGLENTQAGRTSSYSEGDPDTARAMEGFKKVAANRVVKEEYPRNELRKAESLGGGRTGLGSSGKKGKEDNSASRTNLSGQSQGDAPQAAGRHNVESITSRVNSAKMKDLKCIDVDRKGAPTNSDGAKLAGLSSGTKHGQHQLTSLPKQTAAARVSRSSKRASESIASKPKKRVRR